MQAPTLLIVAERDISTVEHAQDMPRALPDGRLEVGPNADHGLPMGQSAIVAALVLDFLQSA